MKEYNIEFSTTVCVEANDEDEAVTKAIMEIAPDDTINVHQFYISCNGKGYN